MNALSPVRSLPELRVHLERIDLLGCLLDKTRNTESGRGGTAGESVDEFLHLIANLQDWSANDAWKRNMSANSRRA